MNGTVEVACVFRSKMQHLVKKIGTILPGKWPMMRSIHCILTTCRKGTRVRLWRLTIKTWTFLILSSHWLWHASCLLSGNNLHLLKSRKVNCHLYFVSLIVSFQQDCQTSETVFLLSVLLPLEGLSTQSVCLNLTFACKRA